MFDRLSFNAQRGRHDLYRADGEDAEREFQQAFKASVENCEPLVKLAEQMETLSPEKRQLTLFKGLGAAWLECECQADLETYIGGLLVESPENSVVQRGVRSLQMPLVDVHERVAGQEGTWGEFAASKL